MANPTTAEEWSQVSATLTQQATAYEVKRDEALVLAGKIKRALAAAVASGASAAKQDEINNDLTSALVAAGQYQTLANTATAQAQNAAQQASIAASGTTDTNTNALPAGSSVAAPVGNNTAVAAATVPEPVVTNTTIDPATDPDLAQDSDIAAAVAEQRQVDAGYENADIATLVAEQRQVDADADIAAAVAEQRQIDAAAAAVTSLDPSPNNAIGIAKAGARSTATNQDSVSFQKAKDWRVRISLAPGAKYLYKGISKTEAGILAPLQDTDGVIFPYTPNVSVSYAAGYDATDIAHSNYKIFQYKGSSVDSITITGDFTAQDTTEASYLLAVIHFFRSVTKMFYGQDQNPKNGVPPPLCYLSGFGTYQFDNHPMAITNFTYATPTDVDYIRAGSQTNMPGQSVSQQTSVLNTIATAASAIRLLTSNLTTKAPNFQSQNTAINSDATYVPTKISITITAVPVVSRNDISNSFSLKQYASGQLLQGSKRNGGGIW